METDNLNSDNKLKLLYKKGGRQAIIVLGLFLALVAGWYLGNKQQLNNQLKKTNANINGVNPADARLKVNGTDIAVEEIIKKVFRHVYLPGGSVKVETVIDANKLKQVNPVFYQFVKVGDKLIIYSDRAILYDPVADQILDIMHFKPQTK